MNKFDSFITFLQTDNLEKTTAFYEDIMKCKMILDQGQCRIFQIANDSYIGFCSHDFLDKDKNTICLTFVCDSINEVNQWYQHFKANNVQIKDAPKKNEKFKIYNFFAIDPNGITVEIQYFLHPFPPNKNK
ncbi:MAG: VOC family protein [Asgard group archaeon]|nr:VOC family protein [Asgard group archaeon]